MESHDKLCDLDKERSSYSNLIIKIPMVRLSSGSWYLPNLVYVLDQFNNVTALGNLLKSKSNSGLSVSQGGRPGSRGSQVCSSHVLLPQLNRESVLGVLSCSRAFENELQM